MAVNSMRMHVLFMLFLLFSGAFVPIAAATKVQTTGLQYQIDKTPAWVAKVPSPTSPPLATPGTGSTQILLSDIQVRLLGAKPVSYVHIKSMAQERSGLEEVSTIRIVFNPRFETLTLHDLAVFREGKRIDRLKTARIDLAQRERRLEEGVYDEDVEAIVALTDVRIGDSVEYAYSITGENPVFAGKYSRIFGLNREQPITRLAVRIQYPATRKLVYKLYQSNLPVTETLERGIKTLSLSADALPPVRAEQEVPPWFAMFPWLQVTEYESWEEVGAWARSLYSIPTDLSPEIDAVLDSIKGEAKNPQELVVKTLAWVQNEIRYYSVAVGTSSHRPNHPNLTVRQRFGDCKDKAVLLSAMLQRLGIKAEPALVSYQIRKGVADWLPTHQFFDHAIVRVQLGDEAYWLDGTQTYQGSALENLGFALYGKALLTGTANHELADVVAPARSRSGSQVVETFRVTKYGAPTAMSVEQKFYGSFAEWFRRRAAADGLNRLIEMQQADYGKHFPNIALNGDPTVTDDPLGNVITLTQAYNIPQLFSYEAGRATMSSVYARSIVPWLRFPGTPDRKFPLALPYPSILDHAIVVELPAKLSGAPPAPQAWQDRHLALSNRITIDGTRVSFNYGLRILNDHVAAADYPGFSEKFKQASNILFSSLTPHLVDSAKLRTRLARDYEKSDINFRDPDHADNLHQKFLRDYAIADESIRSGLIAGTLLAKAYWHRADAESSLGRREEALTDVTKAIELDANDAAYILKAEIQLYAGRYHDALKTLGLVTQDGGKPTTLIDAGMIQFYLGNYAEAVRNFSKAAEIADSDELPYSLIWLAVAAKKAGLDSESAVKKFRYRLSSAWPAEAVNYLLGESEAEKLVATARQEEKESRLRLCEAYFYIGQKALLDGNVADAKRWFSKSADTKAIMYREHIFSQHELRRLEEN